MPKPSRTCRVRLISQRLGLSVTGQDQRHLILETPAGDEASDTSARLEWVVPPEVADDLRVGDLFHLILRPDQD